MTAPQIVIVVLVGLVAGWLASLIVGGGGLLKYIIWGLLGSIVGGILFPALGLQVDLGHPLLSAVVVATGGAVVLVLVARLIA